MAEQTVTALLDTNVLIARDAPDESAPDLSGFERLVVSSLNWYEVCRRLLMNIGPANQSMFLVLILNIISFWVLRYPLVYLFAEWFGELGIAWGYAVSLVISSAIVTMYYLYGNWREAKIYTE